MLANKIVEEMSELDSLITEFTTEAKKIKPDEQITLATDLENLNRILLIESKVMELNLFFEKLSTLYPRFELIKDFYLKHLVKNNENNQQQPQQSDTQQQPEQPQDVSKENVTQINQAQQPQPQPQQQPQNIPNFTEKVETRPGDKPGTEVTTHTFTVDPPIVMPKEK